MPKKKSPRNRRFRIAGIAALVIIAVILVFNTIVTRMMEKEINRFFVNLPVKQYHFRYERAGFNLINRSVSLTGFRYYPDSAFLDSLDKLHYNVMVPMIAVGRLTVSGIDLINVFYKKNIQINKIKIKQPTVVFFKFNGRFSSANPEKRRGLSVEDSVKIPDITGLSVASIVVNKINFKIYNYRKKKTILFSKNIMLDMHGLELKNSGHGNHYFYPVLHDAGMVAHNNFMQLGDSMYQIVFGQLTVDLKHRFLVLNDFHYRPVYSKEAFSQHLKFQKERFDMKAGEIRFKGVDFYRFFTENEIRIKKIIISDVSFDLYRDKRVPFNHRQRPLLPNQVLKKVKGRLIIDTVQVNNARLEYSEKTKTDNQPLDIYFTGLSGCLTHVTNIPYLWQKNDMKATVKGLFMQKAPMEVTFLFPLAAKSDTFSFRGTVDGRVPLSVFNPAIYPATGLKFKRGILDKITFQGAADTVYSSGNMEMLYHNMEIMASKKNERQKNKLLSRGVNSLVRKNNPRKGKDKSAKKVCLFFRRDMEKGFGNFFWKTIFSGIKGTLLPGFNNINCRNKQLFSPAVRPVPDKSITYR